MPDQIAPDVAARITATEPGSVDDKNRITLSVSKRARLGNPITLLLGRRGGCLEALPQDVWNEKCAEIEKFGLINEGAEDYARLVYGSAQEGIKWDAQGRFVLPQHLRKLAEIQDEIVLVGMGRYLEIWSAEQHAKFAADPDNFGIERRTLFRVAYNRMTGANA